MEPDDGDRPASNQRLGQQDAEVEQIGFPGSILILRLDSVAYVVDLPVDD